MRQTLHLFRYNAELSETGLDRLGVGYLNPEHVQQMDSVDHIEEMRQVRQAVGKKVTMNTSTVSQYKSTIRYLGAESDFESSAFADSAMPALGVKRIRDSA